jgi:phosphoenolpyruvate carboxylase
LSNASVSVLSCDLDCARYAELVQSPDTRSAIMNIIESELLRTTSALERVYGGPLPSARARLARLLALRNDSLRSMHRWQCELLARWRNAGRADEELRRALLGTVNAIAAGLRTTG